VDHAAQPCRVRRLRRVRSGGYISPSTGRLHNAELTNLGTFIGALCFLVGALLLLPERTEDSEAPAPAPVATPGVGHT
jgi:hypothetical protein